MKKLFMAIAVMAILMLPFTSFAMTSMEEGDLSTVTGQAGVSINLDANIHLEVDVAAWGDKDGLGSGQTEATGAGWVGVTGIKSDIRIRANQQMLDDAWGGGIGWEALELAKELKVVEPDFIQALTDLKIAVGMYRAANIAWKPSNPLTFDAGDPTTWSASDQATLLAVSAIATAATNYQTEADEAQTAATAEFVAFVTYKTQHPTETAKAIAANAEFHPLTIDVATDTTTAHGAANTTFVRIGLGSLEIQVSGMTVPVALGGSANPTADPEDQIPDLNQELGSVYMSGLLLRIGGSSYVDIFRMPGNTQGVGLALNVTLNSFGIDVLSWGDKDGFVSDQLNHPDPEPDTNGITENAGYVGLEDLTIDGLTIRGLVTINVATGTATTLPGYGHGDGVTFVRIGMPSGLAIGIGELNATAVLGNEPDFDTAISGTTPPGSTLGTKYVLGTIYMSATTIQLQGSVDIYNPAGKQGVVVSLNNLTIPSLVVDTLSWGDADGVVYEQALPYPSYTTPGYVGLNNLTVTGLTINGEATIDVATVMTGNTSALPVGTTFVRLGFEDGMHVFTATGSAITGDVALGAAKDNLDQVLGSFYISGLDLTVVGGVDIYAANLTGDAAGVGGTQGVVLDMHADIATLNLTALSWGDIDGLGAATNTVAGYVGLRGLVLNTLSASGKIAIDVATVDMTVPVVSRDIMIYHAYESHQLSPTFVHIGLGTGNANDAPVAGAQFALSIGSMAADVALDSVATLANVAKGALGSIYLEGVRVGINGWVDIAAH